MNDQYGVPPAQHLPENPQPGGMPHGNATGGRPQLSSQPWQPSSWSQPSASGASSTPTNLGDALPQHPQPQSGTYAAAAGQHNWNGASTSAAEPQPNAGHWPQQHAQPASNPTYGQPAPTFGGPANAPSAKQRNPWVITGVIALALALIGSLVWGGLALFGNRPGADSPEAAVQEFLHASTGMDVVNVGATVAPSEAAMFVKPFERLAASPADSPRGRGIPQALAELRSAVDVEFEQLDLDPLGDAGDAQVVRVNAATARIDGDAQRAKAAMNDLVYAATYEFAQLTGASPEYADSSATEAADRASRNFADELPTTVNLLENGPTMLVAVQEDGRWYVSLILSGIVSAQQGMGNTEIPTISDPGAKPAATPQEAGKQFMAQFAAAMSGGSPLQVAQTLTRPERLLIGLAQSFMPESNSPYTNTNTAQVEGDFTVERRGEYTFIRPKKLRVTAGSNPVMFDGDCVMSAYGDRSCIGDFRPANALKLHELGLVVKQEQGGWLVSPYGTAALVFETAVNSYIELRESGRLHELQI